MAGASWSIRSISRSVKLNVAVIDEWRSVDFQSFFNIPQNGKWNTKMP